MNYLYKDIYIAFVLICIGGICGCVSSSVPVSEIADHGDVEQVKSAVEKIFIDEVTDLSFLFDEELFAMSTAQRRWFVLAVAYLYWESEAGDCIHDEKRRHVCTIILRFPFSAYARYEAKRIALYSSHQKDVGAAMFISTTEKSGEDYPFWLLLREKRPDLAESINIRIGKLFAWDEPFHHIYDHLDDAGVWAATNRLDRMRLMRSAWQQYSLRQEEMYDGLWQNVWHNYAMLKHTEHEYELGPLVPERFVLPSDAENIVKYITSGILIDR